MPLFFNHYPVFVSKPKDIAYYWRLKFLQEAKALEIPGDPQVWEDFGDLSLSFPDWFGRYEEHLYDDGRFVAVCGPLESGQDAQEYIDEGHLIVAINLKCTFSMVTEALSDLLPDYGLRMKAGRAPLEEENGNAKYGFFQIPDVRYLRDIYRSYKFFNRQQRRGKSMTHYQMAEAINAFTGGKGDYWIRDTDSEDIKQQKREDATKMFSRYLKDAQRAIYHVAYGRFPCFEEIEPSDS